jgi:hypothetical protein
MSLRSWSLTTYWVVSTIIWTATAALVPLAERRDWLQVGLIAMAFSPAFLAGAWAAHHPEIAHWPRVRIFALWGFAVAVILAVGDAIDSWKLPSAVIGAPLAILTLRWLETMGARREPDLPLQTSTPVPTPPNTPLAG